MIILRHDWWYVCTGERARKNYGRNQTDLLINRKSFIFKESYLTLNLFSSNKKAEHNSCNRKRNVQTHNCVQGKC